MKNDIITVVIPCYNLAGYTRRCLDSVLGQSYRNLEVIVVDDGSIDETPEILKAYSTQDSRVVFLQQEHKGAGEAINQAISVSNGNYIAFVDNDDWIEPTTYEKLYYALTKNHADISVCNYNLVYKTHTDFCYSKMKNETVSVQEDPYGYFSRYCACPKPNNYTWTKLYKSDLIRNSDVRFEEYPLGADTLFNFKLLPRVDKVSFISDGLYNYVQRDNSSVYTLARKVNIAQVYADGFEALADYYMQNRRSDFCRVLSLHAYTRLRSIFFYSRLAGISDEEITKNIMSSFKGRKIVDYLTGAMG